MGMVVGSTILGLALHLVTPMASVVGGMVGLAAGAAWAYRRIAWRIGIAIAAVVVLRVVPPSWPALALVASLLAIGLAIGVRGMRGVITVMVGGLTSSGATLRTVSAHLCNNRERDVLGGYASDSLAAHGDAHALRSLLPDCLRHQDVRDLGGADAEGVSAESAMCRRVAVAAHDE